MTPTLDLEALDSWDDAMLAGVLDAVQRESQRRALERCDAPAVVEEAFRSAFTSRGMPLDPYVRSGVLVCPGGKVDKSAMSHECCFVRVDRHWVWESPDRFDDVIRHVPGPRQSMRSVSLVVAREGMEIDVVASRLKAGVHQLASVRSFVVESGELVLVSARAVSSFGSHR